MTEVIEPRRRGMPPVQIGRPACRLTNYTRNAVIYFYQEAVKFMELQRGDGIRILKTGSDIYLHHVLPENVKNPAFRAYRVGGRHALSLTCQIAGYTLPAGTYEILPITKHPEVNVKVHPLKFLHK